MERAFTLELEDPWFEYWSVPWRKSVFINRFEICYNHALKSLPPLCVVTHCPGVIVWGGKLVLSTESHMS